MAINGMERTGQIGTEKMEKKVGKGGEMGKEREEKWERKGRWFSAPLPR